jgi:hypothetical protein
MYATYLAFEMRVFSIGFGFGRAFPIATAIARLPLGTPRMLSMRAESPHRKMPMGIVESEVLRGDDDGRDSDPRVNVAQTWDRPSILDEEEDGGRITRHDVLDAVLLRSLLEAHLYLGGPALERNFGEFVEFGLVRRDDEIDVLALFAVGDCSAALVICSSWSCGMT